MESFREKIVAIYFEAEAVLHHLIYEHGTESKHNGLRCLPIPEGYENNIDHTYLSEVNINGEFVSEDGLTFNFDCISMDRFCEIVDAIKNKYT